MKKPEDPLAGIKAALRYLIQKDVDVEIAEATHRLDSGRWRLGMTGMKDREAAIRKAKREVVKKYKPLMDGLK